jgi:hypothetical protein
MKARAMTGILADQSEQFRSKADNLGSHQICECQCRGGHFGKDQWPTVELGELSSAPARFYSQEKLPCQF